MHCVHDEDLTVRASENRILPGFNLRYRPSASVLRCNTATYRARRRGGGLRQLSNCYSEKLGNFEHKVCVTKTK